MHLQKSGDKINKLNEKKESVNFEKMFRNVKQNSISRPSTSKQLLRKKRPLSLVLKTQQIQRSVNKKEKSTQRNQSTSLNTLRKFYPHPLSTTHKNNMNLHLITNSCFKKVYETASVQEIVNHFSFNSIPSINPQNSFKAKKLKSYKKKSKHYKFKKSDLDVRIQGTKVF